MTEQLDVTKLETGKLKEMAYDLIVQIQQLQNALNIIQNELIRRANEPAGKPAKDD